MTTTAGVSAPSLWPHQLADTLRWHPDPALLDLGTGTAHVPPASDAGLAHAKAVDVSWPMLAQARVALTPVLERCTLTLVHAMADTYAPVAGEEQVWAPDLITCCRSYHWMGGPVALATADRVAAPDATMAIMGDGSLRTHASDWTRALRELIQRYLGPGRRAGARRDCTEPRRLFEESRAASAWSDVTQHRIAVTRTWTTEDVFGYVRTTSYAGAELFGERHPAFETAAQALLDTHAGEEPLVESAVFRIKLARRPGGAV
ncbi:class I SAM-dependent methyltransferase (plasmid) [Streptomyces sp. NBC_00445]|uniref:class I SAM-dependent methyltransferase n=1 Tax=Streptomyces sp. NBC_00445 TaxID=2975745 RepID=UPI002E2235F9